MATEADRRRFREAPPRYGPDWPNNGEIHERMRIDLLVGSEEYEAAGDPRRAEEYRARAVVQRHERDSCFKQHERRVLNRRVRHGSW